MADSFGARMRQHREERQIDLVAIAEQTKIKLTLLEALEHDDVSHWPSGIFRRAYVRTYAQSIGLDPDAVVREFLECYPDPGDTFAALGEVLGEVPKSDGPPPTRLRNIVDSALASLARRRKHTAGEDPRPVASPIATTLPGDVMTVHVPAPVAPLAFDGAVSDTLAHVTVSAPDVPSAASIQVPHEFDEPACVPDVPLTPVAIEAPVPVEQALEPEADRSAPPTEIPAAHVAARVAAVGDATLETLARLCTRFGQLADRDEAPALLHDAADALNATGLIVWVWDERESGLKPALVHGYSRSVLAHLPTVRWDADNATAAAFRSRKVCQVAAQQPGSSSALVVPLLVPDACAGVLAIELQPGVEPAGSTAAAAVLIGASLAQLVHRAQPAAPKIPDEEPVPAVMFRAPARPMKVRR